MQLSNQWQTFSVENFFEGFMKKCMALWLAGIFIVFMSVSGASADSYYSTFPPGTGDFTFDDANDFVTYTFTGTGLKSITSVLFNPNIVSYFFPPDPNPNDTIPYNPVIVIDVIVNGIIVNHELSVNPMWVIRPWLPPLPRSHSRRPRALRLRPDRPAGP